MMPAMCGRRWSRPAGRSCASMRRPGARKWASRYPVSWCWRSAPDPAHQQKRAGRTRPFFIRSTDLLPAGAIHQLERRLVVPAEHRGIDLVFLEFGPAGDHRMQRHAADDREFVVALGEVFLGLLRSQVFEEPDRVLLVR